MLPSFFSSSQSSASSLEVEPRKSKRATDGFGQAAQEKTKRPALADVSNRQQSATAPSSQILGTNGKITGSFQLNANLVTAKQKASSSQMVTRSQAQQQQRTQQTLYQQQPTKRHTTNQQEKQTLTQAYHGSQLQNAEHYGVHQQQYDINNNDEHTSINLQCKDTIEDLMEVEESSVVHNIDCREEDDPLHVTTYVQDIYSHLKISEEKYQPLLYMTVQTDISPNMRGILIDWLIEVAEEYKLASETLYLTINYIDRFLSKQTVARGKLQLVGVVCMLIASKFEEVYAPAVDEFVYISDNTYSKEEIFEMEGLVLNVLSFQLTAPTTKVFLRRFLKAAGADTGEVAMLANYLCELTMLDYNFIQFLPSMIAASAVYLALHTVHKSPPTWSPTLEYYTGYSLSTPLLKKCISELLSAFTGAERNALKAVREKYSQTILLKVSTLQPPKGLAWDAESVLNDNHQNTQ